MRIEPNDQLILFNSNNNKIGTITNSASLDRERVIKPSEDLVIVREFANRDLFELVAFNHLELYEEGSNLINITQKYFGFSPDTLEANIIKQTEICKKNNGEGEVTRIHLKMINRRMLYYKGIPDTYRSAALLLGLDINGYRTS